MHLFSLLLASTLGCVVIADAAAGADGVSYAFVRAGWFAEQTCTREMDPDLRVHVNKPPIEIPTPRDRLLVYALPNGNTLEQTLGCRMTEGLDWHYDIQHVAAQLRLLRTIDRTERMVLVCAEAKGLSWPAWRRNHHDANQTILSLVGDWRKRLGGKHAYVTLAGHSGGGSFIFGLIEAAAEIPEWIDRIVFLDANYSFDATIHEDKLQRWLAADPARHLIVLAYDDRRIELNGKRVVGPEGGTLRATRRMRTALQNHFAIRETAQPPFKVYQGLKNRIRFVVHTNPDNKILHTALVGEMNGLIHAQTWGTAQASTWGSFGGPRAYSRWIQPLPTSSGVASTATSEPLIRTVQPDLPPRPADAIGGIGFMERVESLSLADREASAYAEITHGNFPQYLRHFKRIPISGITADGRKITALMDVMCDYLAVGSDSDFVRLPLRPQTAQRIADHFGCVLPTRKMVDTIDRHAELHLPPRPMTEARESVATFVEHHTIVESQRSDWPLGALVTGIKKDVVLSPRIFERPHRLAIYGWRKLDGRPIQNLTIVHVDQYVDYSHGIRLVAKSVLIDGQAVTVSELLQDEQRCVLVSDEGPMRPPRYPDNR